MNRNWKMMKRILSLTLAILLTLSCVPVQVFATETESVTKTTEMTPEETTVATEAETAETTEQPTVPETTAETEPMVEQTAEATVPETTEETVPETTVETLPEITVEETAPMLLATEQDLSAYQGKVISILGDSISTFAGYIPKADGFNLEHLARYPQDNLLTDVNDTWWMQVVHQLDAKLGVNDSWRGSTVSGYPAVTTGVTGYLAAMSNPTQIQNLGSNGTPDVILFYGGTNDLAHTPKLGSFDPSAAPFEVNLTTLKWDNMADGYVNAILRLRHFYPNAVIIALLPTYTASYYSNDKLAQGNAILAAICQHYGVPYVDLRECGISVSDLPDGIHPDAKGMDYITNAVLEKLSSCEIAAGENVVHSVTHNLSNAKASRSYYKGISTGTAFEETLTGENLAVTVLMNGKDITADSYQNGKISIPKVTGDLTITAKAAFSLGDHLRQLPEKLCAGTNLWTLLEHDPQYYYIDKWDTHSSGKVYSLTVPVTAGDRIYATSIGTSGSNGGTMNGIRVTFFGETGVLRTMPPEETYAEFSANGYLTAPDGAVAVNVPMWNNSADNKLYLLNRTHVYSDGTCTVCGDSVDALQLCYDDHVDISGKNVEILDAGKPTSYQVGYGVADGTLDTAVVAIDGDALVATGVGAAKVRIDGKIYEVTVTAAPISLLLLIGQSNMRGSEGNPDQSIICPDGMVYSTYGDDRGATNTAMTVDNAHLFAPSALTGQYSTVNVAGTEKCISGYPLDSLTAAGAGRMGPDSGFAYEWVKQTGEKVWVVNAAHGGSSITSWQNGAENYEECVRLFQACQQTLQKEIEAGHYTLSHMGYFWCQGCTDRTKTAQWYVEKYLAMHSNLKTELAFDGRTFEFGGIIPVRVGNTAACYRDGVYEVSNPYAYHESFVDLRFNGPRVAQYWMCNNPELKDIWMVCNIGEDWVWMPDGTNGVADYFQRHYENGIVDYTPQKTQSKSWYAPTTPKAVHDSVHYNQIGYNEIGRESVRNALILLGETEAPKVETQVELLTWDGYTQADKVIASATGNSATLVVPKITPLWKTKDVSYTLSEGLNWNYYDLLAAGNETEGTLTVHDLTVSVSKGEPGLHYADHLSQLPENLCPQLNLWSVLEHDPYYFASGTNWGKHSSREVPSVTIPVNPGDRIFATSFGAATENGHGTANGIRVTFFSAYGVAKTMDPAGTYAEFSKNGGYLVAPEGATAINIAMWNNSDDNEIYILNRPHSYEAKVTAPTCTEKGYTTHTCSVCGDSYTGDFVGATGEHTYKNGICAFCQTASPLLGKNVSILGDSISTFAGVSQCSSPFYNGSNRGVQSVYDTWWGKLIEDHGMSLCVNYSQGGVAMNNPVIYNDRVLNLHIDTSSPDVIFVFLGHNDKLEQVKPFEDIRWSTIIQENADGTYTYSTPDSFTEAYAIAVHKMLNKYPAAEVVLLQCLTDGTIEQYNLTTPIIQAIGDKFGLTVVDFYGNGLSRENKTYFPSDVHPSKAGMMKITEILGQALETIHLHRFNHVVTTPTCTEQGYTTHTCTVCGDSYVDSYVAAKGHTEVIDKAIAATCTTAGKTEGKHCSVCSAVIVAQKEIPAKGHTEVTDKAVSATCTTAGKTEGKHCSTCGTVLVAQKEIPAQGHSYGAWTVTTAPTCTEKGTERRDCSNCNHSETRDIAAKGHTEVTDKAISATCTTAGKTEGKHCSVCNTVLVKQNEIPAKGHTWDAGKVTKEPTEQTEGVKTYTCTVCGETKTQSIPVLSHTHKYTSKVTAPTCTEQGYTTYTCACGDSYVDNYVKATGHSYGAWTVTTKPTCTEKGLERRDCNNCDHYETREVTANGHTEVIDKAVAATCIETGLTEGKHCSVCNIVLVAQKEVPAKGHTWDNGKVTKEPTEKAEGIKTFTCIACGETKKETIPTLEHTHKYTSKVTAPTCTAQGYTTYTCSCGDSYVDNYVKATGHSYGAWTVISKPACTEKGTERRDCNNCDHSETRDIAAKGHTEVTDKAVSATCTTAGKTEGKHCSTCGTVLVAQKEIPAPGHSYGAWTVTTAPTCTEKGQERRDCANCDAYETREVAAKGHIEVIDKAVAATCTAIGLTEGKHCSVCSIVLIAQKEIPVLGHSYGAWTVTTKPTCTEKGQERRNCNNCDHYETREVTANGHTEVIDKAVAATCIETGLTEGKHCSVCNTILIAQKEVPAKGHSWDNGKVTKEPTEKVEGVRTYTCTACGETKTEAIPTLEHSHKYTSKVTAPTCTAQGYTTYTCTCGDSYVDNYVKATDHSYGAWTVTTKPTCTEKGSEHRDCSNCDHYETREVAAKGHTEVIDKTVAATCTTAGKTEGKHCSTCGIVLVTQNTIPAKGHTWDAGKVTKEPTEQTEGVKTFTCTVCGETKTQNIPVLSHTHKYTAKVTTPTCTEQGYTTYTCTCGDSYVDNYVNATGHSYGSWEVVTNPICTTKGQERRDCANCDAYETRDVAAKGHTEVIDKAVSATCTTAGKTEGKHCSVCGTVLVTQNTIPAKGHTWDAGKITKEPTEQTEGVKTFTCTVCGETKTEAIPTLDHTHKYTAKVTAPTCTAQGYTTYTCSCGDSYVDNYVKAAGHSYGAWTVTTKPSCTEIGTERRDCNNCDHYETREVAAKGHVEVIDKAVAATCTTSGLTEGKHCSVCNTVLVAQMKIAALGHSWDVGVVTKEPTETEEGESVFTCQTCGETKIQKLPTLSHVHKYTAAVTAPTCTEQGYTTYTCSCGDSYVDEYVEAIGHEAGQWQSDEKGHWRVCAVCSEILDMGVHSGTNCTICGHEPPEQGHGYDLGDVNHDGKINAKDATLILQKSVGVLKETAKFCEDCAEVSGDGKLNAKDSTLILQFSVGLRETFPAEQ